MLPGRVGYARNSRHPSRPPASYLSRGGLNPGDCRQSPRFAVPSDRLRGSSLYPATDPPTIASSTAVASSTGSRIAATSSTARARISTLLGDSVQPVVQRSAGLAVSALFSALTTPVLPPPELKVTGSIPVGSISVFTGNTHDSRRFAGFLVVPSASLDSSRWSRSATF